MFEEFHIQKTSFVVLYIYIYIYTHSTDDEPKFLGLQESMMD